MVQKDSREKLEDLKTNLADMGGMLVAFSGGVDSSFLAFVAYGVLGGASDRRDGPFRDAGPPQI